MTPADIIVVMLSNAIKTAQKKEDRQSLIVVLVIIAHVIKELPGDNCVLLSYLEQCIKQFGLKTV
jgi:hypothetical protein